MELAAALGQSQRVRECDCPAEVSHCFHVGDKRALFTRRDLLPFHIRPLVTAFGVLIVSGPPEEDKSCPGYWAWDIKNCSKQVWPSSEAAALAAFEEACEKLREMAEVGSI